MSLRTNLKRPNVDQIQIQIFYWILRLVPRFFPLKFWNSCDASASQLEKVRARAARFWSF